MSVTKTNAPAPPVPDPANVSKAQELCWRLLQSANGALDLVSIYLGHHLGYYRALVQGPATSEQLAARTGTAERYAREWLEQQAVTGFLQVDDASKDARRRVFSLAPGAAEVFTDRASREHFVPGVRSLVAAIQMLPQTLHAYRTGGGVPWTAMGQEMVDAQGGFNEAIFRTLLAQEDIPAVPDVHARLQADPPARVADVACGAGWASIALAKAYPKARIEAFDVDPRAIEQAKANAKAEGVEGRIAFAVRDARALPAGRYDAVLLLECLHDLAHPVEALRAVRASLAPGGAVIVMDEKAEEAFAPNGSEIERLCYGFSIAVCLPGGLGEKGAAGTGTVMRPAILRKYAEDAGFAGVEVLPIENDPLRRWYRLVA